MQHHDEDNSGGGNDNKNSPTTKKHIVRIDELLNVMHNDRCVRMNDDMHAD